MQSTVLITNSAAGTTWDLLSAGFANPGYLSGSQLTSALSSSTGFDIFNAATVTVSFVGTYTGATVVHQQTEDVLGVTGWFNVQGFAADGASAGTGVATSGTAYTFPVLGVRHRVQVTALSTGTLSAAIMVDGIANVIMGSVVTTPSATGNQPVIVGNRTPTGYQQIVGMVASTALTVPGTSKIALITCEGQAVRWRDDGTAPTATVGMELQIGQVLMYDGTLSAIRFIQEAATATLNASFYA